MNLICPQCEAATIDPARAPRRGNALFCIHCGAWSMNYHGRLHAPSIRARAALLADPIARQVTRAWIWRHVAVVRGEDK